MTSKLPLAGTTTTLPLIFSTIQLNNDVSVSDAKAILQRAVQLDLQIQALNEELNQYQINTDPNNSPFFDQLDDISKNLNAQNGTLQGYIGQLLTLQATQATIDANLATDLDIFTCFSQSNCVTDVPTTAEPTTPGPTPSVTPCTEGDLAASSTVQFDQLYSKENVDPCSIRIKASVSTNNVSVVIDLSFGGNQVGYVQLVETRTQRAVNFTTTQTGYNFTGFQQVDIHYYADARSSVQFNFSYVDVFICDLGCNNGTCAVSPSGQQYCVCPACQSTGDYCEIPLGNPCSAKQQRACGEKATTPYGKCFASDCYDGCYVCACSAGAETDSPQRCAAPNGTVGPIPPAAPSCPSTAAPITTIAVFTSTIAPAGSTSVQPVTEPSEPSTEAPTVAPAESTFTQSVTELSASISSTLGAVTTTVETTAVPTTTDPQKEE
uniref:EGF-like domain-containing protein n=1 Tax=Caenorhabditis japonica TaxID=281687 RepID=A0A8R1DQ90_CAEJA